METFIQKNKNYMLLLMSLSVFLIYANTLHCPFIFDDYPNIVENSAIRIEKLHQIFGLFHQNRPVSKMSFALNYYVHDYQVFGYHTLNILIHMCNSVLLFLFIRLLLTSEKIKSLVVRPHSLAFYSSFIWAVHPLNTQSVTYIVQRMNSLAAFFYLLAFLFYIHFRKPGLSISIRICLILGVIVSSICALGAKQNAVTLPVFILLYELLFVQNLKKLWLDIKKFHILAVLIISLGLTGVFFGPYLFNFIHSTYDERSFTLLQRLLTEQRILIFYLSLYIFPHPSRLNLDHDIALSYSLINPISTLSSVIVIIGCIGFSLRYFKKYPILSFVILWYFGQHIIESSVIGLELIYEHRNYIPSMLLGIPIGQLICKLSEKREFYGRLFFIIVLAVLHVWTVERNEVWQSQESVWLDCMKKSPKLARPYNNYGYTQYEQTRYDIAIEYFNRALAIQAFYPEAQNNLGLAYQRLNQMEKAIKHFKTAIAMAPNDIVAYNNYGKALRQMERFDDAIEMYQKALAIKPDSAEVHNNLGVAFAMIKKYQQAAAHFEKAIQLYPGHKNALKNLNHLKTIQKKFPAQVP